MATREAPNTTAPQAYAVVSRFTRRPLRPVILLTSGLAAFWSLFSSIGSFRVFAFDNDASHGLTHLAPFAIALGAIYAAILVTQVFGMFAAYTQKSGLISTYSFLAIFAGAGIAATGFIEVVTHFAFKNDLINGCAKEVDGELVFFGWGFWGPSRSERLDADDAQRFCQRAWDRESASVIISLLILCFYGVTLAMLGRAYLHQSRNPEFGRTVVTQAVPVSYGPAYASNPGYPPQGPPPGADYYGPSGGYAPPPGPPNAGFAPPPGPPPQGMGYGAGLGPQPKSDPFADPKVDNPFADGARMPDAEQGYKVEGNSSFK